MAKKAAWSISSCKPGNGVLFLRVDNLDTYWHRRSDGAQPHLVNIQFQKKVKLQDALLTESVKKHNGKNWKSIELFKNRTDVQCLHRWQKVLDPELVKGAWTKEEDDLILSQVKLHGTKNWSVIAKSLPGRIGKQCRERLFRQLPSVSLHMI
ncbi:transcription factor MYB3R-5-like isoform X2 [Asparagus officinalis]|uniref:transcription factor MYB3R-5-like isoform X2 n=1 Tax=Asparagus officinalis TaxID=4686 RepID=UPI00098DFC1F|nr:transcription factor MYB3R-5-like isoform X2 [Asparagus officinalis]